MTDSRKPRDSNTVSFAAPMRVAADARLTVQQALARALHLYERRDLAASEALCRRIVDAEPTQFEALHLLGIIAAQTGRAEQALTWLQQAVAQAPDVAIAHCSLGNVLGDLRRPEQALQCFERAIALQPDNPEAYYNRGFALSDLKRHADAVASYERAIALAPGHADAHNNRGNALRELKRHAEALASYEKAIALRPEYAVAHYNRGNSLRELRRPEEAVVSFERAAALSPGYAEPLNGRGVALCDLNRPEEAIASYERAIAIKPDYAEALLNRGLAQRGLGRLVDAVASLERALALDPDRPYLRGTLLNTRLQMCDWRHAEAEIALITQRIQQGAAVASPFESLSLTADASIQLRAARIWVAERHPAEPRQPGFARTEKERIRIGYFSADFKGHAMPHLISDLFETHERGGFEVIAFSLGPDVDHPLRRRVAAAVDHFIDVRTKSDEEIVRLSRQMQIDIAVDLTGYTDGCRPGIFSARAAPVQASYLGYPGTMGSDYMDYIVADHVLIPPESRRHYAEKIVYLPHSYQANDRKRAVPEGAVDRASLGLPRDGLVFCCFNNSYKITPEVFGLWMRILASVKGSVLWLLEDNPQASTNLRREAVARNVAPERIVFAPRAQFSDHIRRHLAADLFLDTLPYNAHTTASDALWAGVPVLTCLGESFASRVAASVLHAAGLPELVARSAQEYEALALDLAADSPRRDELRRRLQQQRMSLPLFDTPRFARHIEAAYRQMHERFVAGLAPEHIVVTP